MLNGVKAPGEKYLKSSYMIIKTKTHTHETSKVLDWGATGNWQENSLFYLDALFDIRWKL